MKIKMSFLLQVKLSSNRWLRHVDSVVRPFTPTIATLLPKYLLVCSLDMPNITVRSVEPKK